MMKSARHNTLKESLIYRHDSRVLLEQEKNHESYRKLVPSIWKSIVSNTDIFPLNDLNLLSLSTAFFESLECTCDDPFIQLLFAKKKLGNNYIPSFGTLLISFIIQR